MRIPELLPNALVPQRAARQRRTLSVALAVALVLGAVLLAWVRWDSHREIDRTEKARLSLQVRAVHQNLALQLAGVRAALLGAREDLQSWPEAERSVRARQQFEALYAAMPGMRTLRWVDEHDHVRASNRAAVDGPTPSELADFKLLRTQPLPDVLHVSRPFRGADGLRALNLSVVLQDKQGHYAGVLAATLDTDYFSTLLGSVLYANDMWAAIIHGRGGVVYVNPYTPTVQGLDLSQPGSLFSRHLASGRDSTVLDGPSRVTGDERIIAQQTFSPPALAMDESLVLGVGRSRDAVFGPWWRETLLYSGIYVLFAVAASLLLRASLRRQQDQDRLAAETLARSAAEAERLALVLDGGDLALWDAHVPSGQGTVNERWYSMLGYTRSDISANQSDWEALVHPDDLPRVKALHDAHIAGHTQSYEAQYRLRHHDGHWVWVLDRGRVVERDAQGRALRMVGTHLDISARVEADEALRKREAQLARVTDVMPGPVAHLDSEGRYRFANAAYRQWFGLEPAAMIGRTRADLFGAEVAAVIAPQVQRALEGETLRFDCTVPTLGGPRDAIHTLLPDRDSDGQVRGMYLVVTDITERRRAEQQLRLLQAAVADLNDVVVITEADPLEEPGPAIVFVNDAFERTTGWRREDVIGRSPRFLIGAETDATVIAHIEQALAEGRGVRGEIVNYTRQGQPYWVDIALAPVRDDQGRVTHIISVHRDITERRQAETERRLLELQLREAQKIESIGTLAGGIAHDFNNILAAILGNVALARGDLPPEHSAQLSLEQVHKASLRARSLVQQILTFSRRQPNPLVVQPLQPMVEETLALLRATLPAAVRVETDLATEPLWLHADATQIQQVLMNLFTNAWHALPGGRGRIEIGCARIESDAPGRPPESELALGPAVHLWVRDDGVGMDAATRERIFDPFFTTKPVGQGTGLGLSVVHGIVRGHEGCARVDSAPGQGSTFHLYFPLAAPPGPSQAARESGAAVLSSGGGQSVLYVDDDEVMLLMVERLLQRQGYAVTVCAQAALALQHLNDATQRFDVVVTDYNMPDISGIELARQVARVRPGLPVVISSGFVTEDLHAAANELGVRALLNKERTLEELPPLLQRVLGAASSSPPAPAPAALT